MATYRRDKLEELIKRVIGDTLLKEVKDPRIGFVSVVGVKLSPDYSMADVSVSVLGDEKNKHDSIKGLYSAKGFLRSAIGKNVKLRIVPDLKFHLDDTIEKGNNMVNLIDSLVKKNDEEDTDSEQ